MGRSKFRLILGMVLVAVAIGLIAYGAMTLRRPQAVVAPGQTAAVAPREDLVPVVVALRDIGRGEKIEQAKLSVIRVQAPAPAGSLSDLRSAVDAVALSALPAGQIVLQNTILAPGDTTKPGLSVLIPEGMRAVALRVNDEVAVGNFLRADDLVDIQLVLANTALGPTEEGGNPERRESRVVLQALRVLSVGEALTEEAGGPGHPDAESDRRRDLGTGPGARGRQAVGVLLPRPAQSDGYGRAAGEAGPSRRSDRRRPA